MNKSKTLLLLVAVTLVAGIGGMTVYAESVKDTVSDTEERKWVQNMENRGIDPSIKPGYDCAHGKMSFGCNQK